MNKTGLLVGKKEVSTFLDGASDYMLKKYLRAGMPVLIEDGKWFAHKENIEDFFKKYTRRKVTEMPAGL